MKLNKEDYRAANADNLTCSINEQILSLGLTSGWYLDTVDKVYLEL